MVLNLIREQKNNKNRVTGLINLELGATVPNKPLKIPNECKTKKLKVVFAPNFG